MLKFIILCCKIPASRLKSAVNKCRKPSKEILLCMLKESSCRIIELFISIFLIKNISSFLFSNSLLVESVTVIIVCRDACFRIIGVWPDEMRCSFEC